MYKEFDNMEPIVIERGNKRLVIKVQPFHLINQCVGVAASITDLEGKLLTGRKALRLKPIED